MHERLSVEQAERGTTTERTSHEPTVRIRHRARLRDLAFFTSPGYASATGHGKAQRSPPMRAFERRGYQEDEGSNMVAATKTTTANSAPSSS